MQIRADYTKEELMNDSDPLHYTCFPLGKMKLLSDMFCALHFNPDNAENIFNMDNLFALHSLLDDAKKEIELLVDVSNKQYRKLRARKKSLENVLKDCIASLEDPNDKPDPKTMAVKLRKQLKD